MAFNCFEITREFDDARIRESWIFSVAVRERGEVSLLLESFVQKRWDDEFDGYMLVDCAYNAREFAEMELELPVAVEQELRREVREKMIDWEIVCQDDCRDEMGRRTGEQSFVVLAGLGNRHVEGLPITPQNDSLPVKKITGGAVYFAPKPTGH